MSQFTKQIDAARAYVQVNDEWIELLVIPAGDWATKLGDRPRRLLLYAIFCIVGCRGRMVPSPDSTEDVDYDSIEPAVFYYLAAGEACFLGWMIGC